MAHTTWERGGKLERRKRFLLQISTSSQSVNDMVVSSVSRKRREWWPCPKFQDPSGGIPRSNMWCKSLAMSRSVHCKSRMWGRKWRMTTNLRVEWLFCGPKTTKYKKRWPSDRPDAMIGHIGLTSHHLGSFFVAIKYPFCVHSYAT